MNKTKKYIFLMMMFAGCVPSLEAGWRDWFSSWSAPFLYARAWAHEQAVRLARWTYGPRYVDVTSPVRFALQDWAAQRGVGLMAKSFQDCMGSAQNGQPYTLVYNPAFNVDGVTYAQAREARNGDFYIQQGDADVLTRALPFKSTAKMQLIPAKQTDLSAVQNRSLPQLFHESALLQFLSQNKVCYHVFAGQNTQDYPVRSFNITKWRWVPRTQKAQAQDVLSLALRAVVRVPGDNYFQLTPSTTDILLQVAKGYTDFSNKFMKREITYPVTGQERGIVEPPARKISQQFCGGEMTIGPRHIVARLQQARQRTSGDHE